MSKIIVLAEQELGKVVGATFNAIGAAKALAEIVGGGFDIAVAGADLGGVAGVLATYGADTVYVMDDAKLAGYTAQGFAPAFEAAVKASGASFVLAAGTAKGRDTTPRVAARLEAGMASDVCAFGGDDDEVLYTRPMWAGNVLGQVKINTDIQVATVRPTDFDAPAAGAGGSKVEAVGANVGELRMKFVGLEAVESDRPALTEADVVVSAGRGLKDKEKFESIIGPLADSMNAAIGASRAVVDAGWCPNDWQVGQTGKVVAPPLYFAVGISGAIQHLAGMKGSKTIVAINKDPEAPIFQVADYGLVADLFEVVPELTAKIVAHKG